MAEWWEAAPLVESGADDWWKAAPVVASAAEGGTGGTPRIVQDIQAVGKGIGRAAGAVRDYVSGDKRREFDLPELASYTPKGVPAANMAKLVTGMALSQTPEQQADIVRANLPGAKLSKDKFGNVIVEHGGFKGYINRPGLSGQDLLEAGGLGAVYAASVYTGGPAAPLLARAGVTGLTTAGTSLGIDKGLQYLGSEQPASLPRAAVSGAFGAGFTALTPALSTAANKVASLFRRAKAAGPMAEASAENAVRDELAKAGFKASDITDDMVAEVMRLARDAADPGDAARFAAAKTTPVPVPMSRGQVTMDPAQQRFESEVLKGTYGEGPRMVLKGSAADTQEALRANIPAIQARLSGGAPQVVERGQGMATAQQALVAKEARLKGQVDTAYKTAREAQATVPSGEIPKIGFEVGQAAGDMIAHAPKAAIQLDVLNKIAADVPPDQAGVLVKRLFDWRRTTSKLASDATDKTERTALRAMARRFDESMKDLVEKKLVEGDQEAVKAFIRANKLRAGEGRLFDQDDLVARLVEREGKNLKVAPEAAANAILGASDTGLINRPELASGLLRMKRVLGGSEEGKAAWNAVREEVFLRFASAAEGPYHQAERQFSGVKFLKAWQGFVERNPATAKTLFSDEERKLINQFARVAATATGLQPGGANFSNTATTAAGLLGRLSNALFLGPRAAQVMQRIPVVATAYDILASQQRAALAARGALPTRQIPARIPAAAGAVVGQEAYR